MTHISRFLLLLLLPMTAAACHNEYRHSPPPNGAGWTSTPTTGAPLFTGNIGVRNSVPAMNLNILGRYQSISCKIVAAEPLWLHHSRDGKEVSHWLIPHFYRPDPAHATISNSYTVVQIDNGIWYADGTCPVIITSKIRSVGTGTVMIVEIDPGADFTVETDDIHRVYFLGPVGHGVNVYPIAGGRPIPIKTVNDYVQVGPDNIIAMPTTFVGTEYEEFVKNVLLIVENMYH